MARTPVRATDFTGTNGTNLESFTGATVGGSTAWSQLQSGQGAGFVVIQSNRLGMAFGDGSRFVYRETGGSYEGSEQYAKATLQDMGDFGSLAGVVVRAASPATYYAVRVVDNLSPTSDTYELIKYPVGGPEQSLIGPTNQAFSNGDTIELEAITEGSDCRLRVYRNGVELANYLDTSSPVPGGLPGLYFQAGSGNTIRLDDWEGGDITPDSTPQYARPSADVTDADWLPSTGSDLYAVLDETSADDADYIYTSTDNSEFEIQLSSLNDPASSDDHVIRIRVGAGGIPSGKALVTTLRQGGSTTIASWTDNGPIAENTTIEHTLDGSEADAITDYGDLRVRGKVQ